MKNVRTKVKCSNCRAKDIIVKEVKLLVCENNKHWEYTYATQCPKCKVAISEPLDRELAGRLIAAGIVPIFWDYPVIKSHVGPPITEDDLHKFLTELYK